MNFEGIIIEESLTDNSVLSEVNIVSTKVEPVTEGHQTPWIKQWTLHTIEVPEEKAAEVAGRISKALDKDHDWYADFKTASEHYVIYRDRVFHITDRTGREQYKEATEYGISLGTPIGLTEQERERYVFIIGGTGNGKTTLLQYSILQDIKNGKGAAIVDPHGDMAETLLRHMPKERIKDVIYFNPDDITRPIGMNLLELPEGLSDDDLLREKDAVTESIISVFRKVFSEEDTGGHRIEYVLRNTVQTALTVKDATIFTIFDLLNDPTYRTGIVAKLKDKNLVNFWKHEIGKAGEMQKVKMAAGITAKIGRFLFSASAKRVLEQPKSTIDFDQILDEGKILICNFSKGLIG